MCRSVGILSEESKLVSQNRNVLLLVKLKDVTSVLDVDCFN